VRPLQLVNISIIFGMVVMPPTYYPILRAASDKKLMGKHVYSTFDNTTGTLFLVMITVAALAAIPHDYDELRAALMRMSNVLFAPVVLLSWLSAAA